ncbi:MAG TPA: helix-turn-helix transcriptional regulator [Tepidisphaeraceae bacterium]|nr:helix-turn-helix transcriptional regulator [Tepidisphaeraceae bacterium]
MSRHHVATLRDVQGKSSNQTVARAVRRLRRQREWSQEDFAARARLHRTYVGAIERGETNLTLDTLDRLARALAVDPATLLIPEK